MPSNDVGETRRAIEAAHDRAVRIEAAMGRLIRRFLWLLRIFLGGAFLGAARLHDWKDLFYGY